MYVEFVVEPRQGQPRMSFLRWKTEYLDRVSEPLYVYVDDEYVTTIFLDGDANMVNEAFSLITDRKNPVKVGLWMPEAGYQRSVKVFDFEMNECDFVITP